MSGATAETAFQVDMTEKLKELQKLVSRTEDDLRARSKELTEVHQRLRHDYDQARESERTLDTFESWRDEYLTQVAVGWVLTSVFLRYLEDNALISEVWLAGPGERLNLARDHRRHYFQQNPTDTDREYLQAAFRSVAQLPGCDSLFGEERNPLWLLGPSGDLAKEMINYWQEIEPATGELKRVFGSCGRQDDGDGGPCDTRFLGDLYQDLSEAARKRFALLQTPDFVEEFILDKTLEPAVETFGLDDVRMLDPTCGSGHFLLGGFARLLDKRHRRKPNEQERVRVQKALDGVYGVDLNPFAVAIARFRLLVAALNASGVRRLKDAPNYKIHVAAGDSLLHGFRGGDQRLLSTDRDWVPDAYAVGDYKEANQILSQHYHAVVGNPPYIADKDRAHKDAVRARYSSCHGKFVLAVPFKEMFFDIALNGARPGYVGMITANNFMKREFGSKVIEEFIPKIDLTHVIDTSGAYIPGHGTPTVILFGRNRRPHLPVVKSALGIRGEPSTPDDPSQGKVWRSIVDNIDKEAAENDFITIANLEREKLHKHPWSLAGGGASELKELIEGAASESLISVCEAVGITAVTGEDDVFVFDSQSQAQRLGLERVRSLQTGDTVRDWSNGTETTAIWPYDTDLELKELGSIPKIYQLLWRFKSNLSRRKRFGTPMLEKGATWYEWQELYKDKLKTPLTITFAEVATHNHFVLDRGGKVFKQTAPVIKLRDDASEDEHFTLLGLLNSSVGNFWVRQCCHNKGSTVDLHGARQCTIPFEDFYQRSGTRMAEFPVVNSSQVQSLAKRLDHLATESQQFRPAALGDDVTAPHISQTKRKFESLFQEIVFHQEELDWECYKAYCVIDNSLIYSGKAVSIRPGERAFEIVLARKVRAGDANDDWFRRHCIEPVHECPSHWPEDYSKLVKQRMKLIEDVREIRLLEVPEFKRRWNLTPWGDELQESLRASLLTQIESEFSSADPSLTTTARLADLLSRDDDFLQVARLYTDREDFDLTKLVTDLVMSEDVPYISALRYKATGLRKRVQWEKTWDLQRAEDAGEKVSKIPVPPKYASGDYLQTHYWRLRGKLDVPKERFISYPLAERSADPSPVVGWAGWNHLNQAKALATYYLERKEQDGWSTEQLTPLLAGLQELIPWLKQWHNEIHPDYDQPLGDFYQGFLEAELRHHHLTPKHLTDWRPPSKTKGRKGK